MGKCELLAGAKKNMHVHIPSITLMFSQNISTVSKGIGNFLLSLYTCHHEWAGNFSQKAVELFQTAMPSHACVFDDTFRL